MVKIYISCYIIIKLEIPFISHCFELGFKINVCYMCISQTICMTGVNTFGSYLLLWRCIVKRRFLVNTTKRMVCIPNRSVIIMYSSFTRIISGIEIRTSFKSFGDYLLAMCGSVILQSISCKILTIHQLARQGLVWCVLWVQSLVDVLLLLGTWGM